METLRADQLNGTEPRELAIPVLVSELGGKLYALGCRICGDRDEAEDMVQETFLQAFRHWSQFEGRAKASTWLYTIATRICQRQHRKRVGEPDRMQSLDESLPLGGAEMAVVPDDPLSESMRSELRGQLESAIADLPDNFRLPFVLRELVGMDVPDIALILDLPSATVRTRVHRARLRLREAIDGNLPRRKVPPPIFSRQVCLDLLAAKQEALDHHVHFEFPEQIVCEHCSEFFATLDLSQNICHEIATGDLPEGLRDRILAKVEAA